MFRQSSSFLAATLATLIGATVTAPAHAEDAIVVQSTTSTANSGLYDFLLPLFKEVSGITVNVVAVGTGQAIRNARQCDGDILLVHAKADELAFVEDGYGTDRSDLMYNDFVIVGPKSDMAEIAGSENEIDALSAIHSKKALFVSRGDDSGTHKKELSLWEATGVNPADEASGDWYRETGSGMGATLNVALGLGAYTITDRATWISFANKGDFTILFEGDPALFNQYGVIPVNPEVCPSVNAKAARAFADWLVSADGQQAIAAYQVDGQQLFFPNAPGRE